jgi:uncharacterized protein YgiB involved in biofilm formation
MKRSHSIRLVLLGTVGLVGLAGCDDNPLAKSEIFTDTEQCAKSNDLDQCRQALADARKNHLQTAPAFTTKEACEEQFGAQNCQETMEKPGQPAQGHASSFGGSWFMPMMMGYMMGNMMGGARTGQSVYRDTTNTAYSGGRSVGRFDAKAYPPPRSTSIAGVPATQGTGTTSRGGFGRSSAGYSSSS